jgi:glycosyltransferase involved in cell wall biosynthesis
VAVDNGSDDGTAARVRTCHPEVDLAALPVNRGAAGRNVGIARVNRPYVAFCDDHTWWEPVRCRPGSLAGR